MYILFVQYCTLFLMIFEYRGVHTMYTATDKIKLKVNAL